MATLFLALSEANIELLFQGTRRTCGYLCFLSSKANAESLFSRNTAEQFLFNLASSNDSDRKREKERGRNTRAI